MRGQEWWRRRQRGRERDAVGAAAPAAPAASSLPPPLPAATEPAGRAALHRAFWQALSCTDLRVSHMCSLAALYATAPVAPHAHGNTFTSRAVRHEMKLAACDLGLFLALLRVRPPALVCSRTSRRSSMSVASSAASALRASSSGWYWLQPTRLGEVHGLRRLVGVEEALQIEHVVALIEYGALPKGRRGAAAPSRACTRPCA
jgi:hypothetical protein